LDNRKKVIANYNVEPELLNIVLGMRYGEKGKSPIMKSCLGKLGDIGERVI